MSGCRHDITGVSAACRRQRGRGGAVGAGQGEQLGEGGAKADTIALRRGGTQQGAIEPLVVGAGEKGPPHDTLRLGGEPLTDEQLRRTQRGVRHEGLDRGLGAVEHRPVSTAEPGEEGTPHQRHGVDEVGEPTAGGERFETGHVGADV